MGLRVGAGAGALAQPGADSMTLAGMQQAAQANALKPPPPDRSPASVNITAGPVANATETPPAAQQAPQFKSGDDAYAYLKSLSANQETGLGKAPNPAGRIVNASDLKNGGISMVKGAIDHPGETAGSVIGAVVGAKGGPLAEFMGQQAGGFVGKAVDEKIDQYVHGKQPAPMTAGGVGLTALEQAAMFGAGHAIAGPAAGAATDAAAGLMNGGAPVSSSQDMASLTAPIRSAAQDLYQYGQKIGANLFKFQGAAGTIAGATEKDLAQKTAQGLYGPEAQEQLWTQYKKQQDAVQSDLGNIVNILPKNTGKYDVGKIIPDMMEGLGQLTDNLKKRILGGADATDTRFDISKLHDGIMTALKDTGLIGEDYKPRPLDMLDNVPIDARDSFRKSASFLQSFVTDFTKLSSKEFPGPTVEQTWKMLSDQNKGMSSGMMQMPVDAIQKLMPEQKSATAISLADLDLLRRNVLDVSKQFPNSNPVQFVNKLIHSTYYDSLSDLATQKGDEFAAGALKQTGEKMNKYWALNESLKSTMEKNPTAAIDVMVNKADPESTKVAFSALTPDQRKFMSRSFLGDALTRGVDPQTGLVTPKSVMNHLNSFEGDNLDTVFGKDKDAIMDTLKYADQLSSNKLSFGARKGFLDKMTKTVSGLDNPRGMFDILHDLIRSPEVKDMMASEEYTDKLYNYSKLAATKGKIVRGAQLGTVGAGTATLGSMSDQGKGQSGGGAGALNH